MNGPLFFLGGNLRSRVYSDGSIFFDGQRCCTRKLTRFVIVKVNNRMNPRIRIVHGNLTGINKMDPPIPKNASYPTMFMRLRAAIGRTVPPADDPVAVIPNARDRLFLNQCPLIPIVGPNITPAASCQSLRGQLSKK